MTLESKKDRVVVKNWGEALWQKKYEVAFGLVCIGITFLMYALGARDAQIMGGVLNTSSSCIVGITLGVGIGAEVDVYRWYIGHKPDRDRMAILNRKQ